MCVKYIHLQVERFYFVMLAIAEIFAEANIPYSFSVQVDLCVMNVYFISHC